MAYKPFPVVTTEPVLSKYQGGLKHRHTLNDTELPPPETCKSCRKPNRRYATKDNGRGILCEKCNKAIGLLADDIEILKNAIEYLK